MSIARSPLLVASPSSGMHASGLPADSLHQRLLGGKGVALATCNGRQYWQRLCPHLHVEDAGYQDGIQSFQASAEVHSPKFCIILLPTLDSTTALQ